MLGIRIVHISFVQILGIYFSGAGGLPQDSLGKCIATVYVCYACGYNLICMVLAVLVLFVICCLF